jgi:hypothetical protein
METHRQSKYKGALSQESRHAPDGIAQQHFFWSCHRHRLA